MRAARYARYSSENQRRTSIEDQLRGAATEAAREGLDAPADLAFSDGEESAYTPIERRPGSARLMLAAADGAFEVLIIEALDRFSRNLVDQERMVQRLEHRGIRIIAYTDGYDTRHEGRQVMRQIRGSMNEDRLRDIGKKTHRGLDGQIARGYHAGGISYGYRSTVAGIDARGEPIGHHLEVDEVAAGHVRWIFERFAQGWSCQAIAADLNRRQVRAPRGGSWAVSALYGSPNKGSGVLNNELYVGRYIWNRSRWVKDPDTGRRERLPRPPSEWKVDERPHLAIVDWQDWDRVRARIGRNRAQGGSKGKGAKPRTLFGGLLNCGLCGGAVVAVNANRYGCAARKDRGETVCRGLLVSRKGTDARLLTHVRETLLDPSAMVELQDAVREILAERRRQAARRAPDAKARESALRQEIVNLVEAIGQLGISQALKARLQAAERELGEIEADRTAVSRAEPDKRATGILTRFKGLLMDLGRNLESHPERARAALSELLGPIRLVPEADGCYAELSATPRRLLLAAGDSYLGVVAGAGFGSQIRIRLR